MTSSTAKGSVLKGILLFLEGRLGLGFHELFFQKDAKKNSIVCKDDPHGVSKGSVSGGGFVGLPPFFGQQSVTVL